MGLFILSLLGLAISAYYLLKGLANDNELNHFIFTVLLVIVLLNSIVGIIMNYPKSGRRRMKL